ncbi:MAG: Na-translocating system protein MpsC family protein [Candidatus Methylomirabilales bacterium]
MNIYTLEHRLADIARGFFQSKLRIKPQGIEVLQQGELIVLRIRGFLAQAEAAMLGRPKEREVLTTYYERIFESLYPLLRVVIQEACQRPVMDRRVVIDLYRNECVYLLTLGEAPAVIERKP